MNIKSRLLKLEQEHRPAGLVVIAVDDGETNEQAYQRFFADGVKPKVIIYATPLDVRL